jgi:hypothetical protein
MTSAKAALRGVLAGASMVGFINLFLFAQGNLVSLRALAGIGFISFIALIAAGGFSAAQQLIIIGGDAASESTKSNESDWWVARAISPLKESWNVWSDAVVILGLGAIGIGSFVLLATDQSENPSLALLFIGFIAGGAALFSLALLAE